jgi:hypothetical protein
MQYKYLHFIKLLVNFINKHKIATWKVILFTSALFFYLHYFEKDSCFFYPISRKIDLLRYFYYFTQANSQGENMKLKPILALFALPLAMSSAHAQDAFHMPTFDFSGFGTLALTRANTSDAEFARPNQLKGVQSEAKNGVDSNFGFQTTAKFNDWFSITGQGLVRKNATDDFTADVSLAFAKVKVSDSTSLRFGRVGIPIYMISDYRNIGYANTMIRPPIEMYSQVGVDYLNGADAIYQTSIGDTSYTAQVALGSIDYEVRGGYNVKFRNIVSLNLVAEHGPFTFRFGRSQTKFSVDDNASLNALIGGLRTFAQHPVLGKAYGFSAAADRLTVKDTPGTFTSLGLSMDWNNIVVQSEIGKRKTDTLSFPSTTAWYTMVGYRMGKFLPYYNHASASQDSARTIANLPTAGIPGVPQAGPLALAAIGATRTAIQTSDSIGVRWDFNSSAALKVQLDRFKPEDGAGTFINAKPTFKGPVTVFAVGVDFVF